MYSKWFVIADHPINLGFPVFSNLLSSFHWIETNKKTNHRNQNHNFSVIFIWTKCWHTVFSARTTEITIVFKFFSWSGIFPIPLQSITLQMNLMFSVSFDLRDLQKQASFTYPNLNIKCFFFCFCFLNCTEYVFSQFKQSPTEVVLSAWLCLRKQWHKMCSLSFILFWIVFWGIGPVPHLQ